jgi:hypothetical protein
MNSAIFYGGELPVQRHLGMACGGVSCSPTPQLTLNYKARTGPGVQ